MSRPTRLLVIEDDEDAADTLKSLLEAVGYRLLAVAPANAEAAVQQFEPACVLLHLGHPNNHWLHLVDSIRALHGDIPVIGLTGWQPDAFGAGAARVGLDALFTKPLVDLQPLLNALPPPTIPTSQETPT